jgi:hypothetical protein
MTDKLEARKNKSLAVSHLRQITHDMENKIYTTEEMEIIKNLFCYWQTMLNNANMVLESSTNETR